MRTCLKCGYDCIDQDESTCRGCGDPWPFTPRPGSAEDLEMCKVMLDGTLAWMLATEKRRLKIESVEHFGQLFEGVQKDAIRVTFEAMKTKEGSSERLSLVRDLWEAGAEFVCKHYDHPEIGKVAVGLSVLRMGMESLMGNLCMIQLPKLRENVAKLHENARRKAAERQNTEDQTQP